MLRVISLGAGVQSTTMALMVARGELELVDCAIFADTQWEPRAVYEHLAWLRSGILPFPVHVVTAGNIRESLAASTTQTSKRKFAIAPWHISNVDGTGTLGRRQCTREYKLEPLRKKQRELLGAKPRQRLRPGAVEVWLGISLDESWRMKPASERWQTNRWPLIERHMSRLHCLAWLDRYGYPRPPKSSCIGCPLRSSAHWRELKARSPVEFADAVEVDRLIRHANKETQYMHYSRQPLDQVDLRSDAELGQLDLFLNECEGMCGV